MKKKPKNYVLTKTQRSQIIRHLEEQLNPPGVVVSARKFEMARNAVKELATPKFRKFLIDTQLGSCPEMIDFFYRLEKLRTNTKIKPQRSR